MYTYLLKHAYYKKRVQADSGSNSGLVRPVWRKWELDRSGSSGF